MRPRHALLDIAGLLSLACRGLDGPAPEGGRCGELVERWSDGGQCEQVFDTCTVGRKAVGIGWPRPVMDCDTSNFELDRATGASQGLERSDGYRVAGTLTRAP